MTFRCVVLRCMPPADRGRGCPQESALTEAGPQAASGGKPETQSRWAGLLLVTACCWSAAAMAQDSAPSSHMVFDDDFAGDVIINQVRVPEAGQAMYTYYEALGWRGTGAGYAGIQSHPRGPNFIFSIWDHPKHREPIAAIHRGAQTKTERFGGEGTGLKSWNFHLGWKPDVWYTLVARTWPVASHQASDQPFTDFGFWAQAGDTQQWTHLVTMRVAAPKAKFEGPTDAFIEDWLSTGAKPRMTHLRAGWKRRLDGTWHPFQSGRYSVNAWDLVEGKRSYNFRNQWDGGVGEDEEGKFYYMLAGGKSTKPTSENPSQHSIPRRETAPAYPAAKVVKLKATLQDKRVNVEWEISKVAAPQFAFQWRIVPTNRSPNGASNGQAADKADGLDETIVTPHARTASKALTELTELTDLGPNQTHQVQLRVRDIFDRWSPWKTCPVTLDDAS